MIKRIVDISEQAYLHTAHKQLLVDKKGETVFQIPIEDLGVVVLQNPAIVLSQSLIMACQKNNVALIFCDERHLPYSVLLPISDANSLHTKTITIQINASVPTKKRLWKQVVQAKIREQIKTLVIFNKPSEALDRLVENVKSGDSQNIEAQAAQKYWRLLFGSNFKRDRNEAGVNSLLNYGYAIMRAMIARTIVGTGLHPALGIKHHNQYNGLCLADDLIEPFRPWVDRIVFSIFQTGMPLEINRVTKEPLLSLVSKPVIFNGKRMPLMVACNYLISDFKQALGDRTTSLTYPYHIE